MKRYIKTNLRKIIILSFTVLFVCSVIISFSINVLAPEFMSNASVKVSAKNTPNTDNKGAIVISVENGYDKNLENKNLDTAKKIAEILKNENYTVRITQGNGLTSAAKKALLTVYVSGRMDNNNNYLSAVKVFYSNSNAEIKSSAQKILNYVSSKGGIKNCQVAPKGNGKTTKITVSQLNNQSKEVKTAAVSSRHTKKNTTSSDTSSQGRKYIMYLTFDDGPSPAYTRLILQVLKKNNIKATFFLVGSQVEKYPEIARQIANEGHSIGVHSYSHDYNFIYKSADAFMDDFKKAQKIIKKATGIESNLLRFPGGSRNSFNRATYKEIIKRVKKDGLVYFDWNSMFGDAGECDTSAEVIRYAVNNVTRNKDVVMLAHDAGAKGNTAKSLQAIIDKFKDKYEFRQITPDTKPVIF